MTLLEDIEACYDAIPRVAGTTEEVGPFTLFLAAPGTGWQFYARPRLGLGAPVTADDVRRVLARQVDLGVPRAIEWVHEVTPSLREAVAEAVPDGELEECHLLALATETRIGGEPGPGRYEVLTPDHPALELVVGAIGAGFDGLDEVGRGKVGRRPELIERGELVMVGSYDADGRVVGGGGAAPRGTGAELMGIATVKSARRQGHGSAITRVLVEAVRVTGVTMAYLSAASYDAASIYRAVGFVDVGSAISLGVSDG